MLEYKRTLCLHTVPAWMAGIKRHSGCAWVCHHQPIVCCQHFLQAPQQHPCPNICTFEHLCVCVCVCACVCVHGPKAHNHRLTLNPPVLLCSSNQHPPPPRPPSFKTTKKCILRVRLCSPFLLTSGCQSRGRRRLRLTATSTQHLQRNTRMPQQQHKDKQEK